MPDDGAAGAQPRGQTPAGRQGRPGRGREAEAPSSGGGTHAATPRCMTRCHDDTMRCLRCLRCLRYPPCSLPHYSSRHRRNAAARRGLAPPAALAAMTPRAGAVAGLDETARVISHYVHHHSLAHLRPDRRQACRRRAWQGARWPAAPRGNILAIRRGKHSWRAAASSPSSIMNQHAGRAQCLTQQRQPARTLTQGPFPRSEMCLAACSKAAETHDEGRRTLERAGCADVAARRRRCGRAQGASTARCLDFQVPRLGASTM